MATAQNQLEFELGVKSDPILYRYSFDWLFDLMADEGVRHLQLGTFFEIYDLPDAYFTALRKVAADRGIVISSIFTAHRELGGFFRDDGPGFVDVARRKFERLIDIASLVGAKRIGSNPGAVLRDRMSGKARGIQTYMTHFKALMSRAADRGVESLTIEPMSSLAEPPTLPQEMQDMMRELDAHHAANAGSTARPGFCVDIAHGYADANRQVVHDHFDLMKPGLPWTCEVHLKNTDSSYDSTFGFAESDLSRGIIRMPDVRAFYQDHASSLPVKQLVGYLEIGGPKLGRDYSDPKLDAALRNSLRHLKQTWLETPAPTPVPNVCTSHDVTIAPSMMCVDPLNFQSALREVESLGVHMLHLDIMDGQFVPNMPMGLGLVQALSRKTTLPLDVHLMVRDNDFFVGALEQSKVARVSVHVESCTHLDRTLSRIRDIGAQAGLAINPGTSLDVLDYVLERIDFVLLMTVNPGFAGQQMTPASIRKIADCRRLLDERGHSHVTVQVDGNVSFENIAPMVAAGADCLVAGTSSIFHTRAPWGQNIAAMNEAIEQGLSVRPARPSQAEARVP